MGKDRQIGNSKISHKFPTYRDDAVRDGYKWLTAKRLDDNAEGLWRIHDSLYDLTTFIPKHPGGRFWLEMTKGTDITEAFETHHITQTASKILPKYKVRDAKAPRNYKFTFEEDGFYKTLKRRVTEQLKTLDRSVELRSKIIIDSLLVALFVVSIFAARVESYFGAIVAGMLLTWTIICAHNYFHKKDNFRMRYFNLCLMSYREWRISHAMSHHLYTNSLHDLEISMFEPLLCWIPSPHIKNFIQRYFSWFYGPIIWQFLYWMELVKRIVNYLTGNQQGSYLDDLIPFSVPLAMFIFGNSNLLVCLKLWGVTITMGSFMFCLIGLNAAHHHPDIYHDGDAMRDDHDFGLYQLDTVMDREDLRGNLLLVLTHFGDHGLHHLFPTLDHAVLPQLYPVLFETLEEFKGNFEACSWFHHIMGQLQQLARIEAHKEPRNVRIGKLSQLKDSIYAKKKTW